MFAIIKKHQLAIIIVTLAVLGVVITIGRLTFAHASNKKVTNSLQSIHEETVKPVEDSNSLESPKESSSQSENSAQPGNIAQSSSNPGSNLNNVVTDTSKNTATSAKTTVTGHVYNSATSNACGNGIIGESCNLPVSAKVEIRNSAGDLVAIVQSNFQGIFTIDLEMGEYQFIPQHKEDINPDAAAITVVVGNSPVDITVIYEAIATTNAINF